MPGNLKKIYVKIGSTKANINFLTRCKKYQLVPAGFKSKQRIFKRKAKQMEDRFSWRREQLNAQEISQNREYFKQLKKLNQKFAQLMSMKEKKPSMKFKLDAVLNLSSKELSQEEHTGPSQGF